MGGERTDTDRPFNISAYLDKMNVIDGSFHSGYLLQAPGWDSGPHCPDEPVISSRRWMKFLKERKYDFEEKNMHGETPLLHHLRVQGRQSLEVGRLLLKFDATVHATGDRGLNALRCAISSLQWFESGSEWEWHSDILEQKLCLLIEAGAAVSHCDAAGDTPSDYAPKRYD